jgi:putative peptidoglycan lipid II flippase
VLATPIIALVFEHGDFTTVDTLATVAALRYHLVGLIFAAIDQPLIFAFYARKDTWTPALVGVATVILYVFLALIQILFASLTLNGLILANSLKWAAHALIMLVFLRRNMGGLRGHGVWNLVAKAVTASILMGGIVHLVMKRMIQIVPTGLVGEVLLVGGSGLVGTVIYGALATLLRMEEVRLLGQSLLGWGQRLTGYRR